MARAASTRSPSQLVVLIAAIVAISALYFARVVFVPFALSILFAFLLTPVVSLLDRLRIPRAASAFTVVTIAVLALGFISWIVTGQLIDVANQLPAYRSNIKSKIEAIYGSRNQNINKAADAVKDIGKELAVPNSPPTPSTTSRNPRILTEETGSSAKPIPVEVVPPASNSLESLNSLIGPASTVGIVIVFTLFMLIRREDLRNRFIRLVGHQQLNVLTQALDDASTKVSRYLSLQLSVNAGYGLVVATGLYLIGVPHVLLWGAVAAVLRFLPYVGTLLSGALPILLAFAMFDGWTRPLLTLALYATVEVIVGNLVEPMLYGAHVGLSSLAILVAAVFWTLLWGPIGLVLSTPLTVCLVVVGRYVPNLGFINILLGDEPVLAPESHFYQRLLATDQQEAKKVLEEYLKENSLQQLYDSVLIPALGLAEQDRHRNDLDESSQQFISLSTKELIEEFFDSSKEAAAVQASGRDDEKRDETSPSSAQRVHTSPQTIVCVPARDDADEIVGTMLAQLLEQAGHRTHCIPLGMADDIIGFIDRVRPDIVCVSALPPFAISHARNLYLRLRSRWPALKIFVGLWGFSGDTTKIVGRMHLEEGDRLFASLEQLIAEVSGEPSIQAISDEENLTSPGSHTSGVVAASD